MDPQESVNDGSSLVRKIQLHDYGLFNRLFLDHMVDTIRNETLLLQSETNREKKKLVNTYYTVRVEIA